jgi:hypothetical protein
MDSRITPLDRGQVRVDDSLRIEFAGAHLPLYLDCRKPGRGVVTHLR